MRFYAPYGSIGSKNMRGQSWSLEKSVYRKSSNKTRGSYSFSQALNAGLIRIWAFLPIFSKFIAGLIRGRVLFEDLRYLARTGCVGSD